MLTLFCHQFTFFCFVELNIGTELCLMKYIYCVRSVFADVHIVLVLVGYIDVDIAVLTIFTLQLPGPEKN